LISQGVLADGAVPVILMGMRDSEDACNSPLPEETKGFLHGEILDLFAPD
jgi:hypothetical protein